MAPGTLIPTPRPVLDDPELPTAHAASVIAGGAGKTQAIVNLSVELCIRGYRVLAWDMDPQRTLSHILGYQDPPKNQPTIYHVLAGLKKLPEAIVPARYRIGEGEEARAFRHIPNLDLVLGTPQMADAEVSLGLDAAGVFWLQTAIDEQLPRGRWDVMLVDCGPTLGILLLSIGMVVEDFIGCVADEYKYIIGLADLETTLAQGRRKFRRQGFKANVEHILATNIPVHSNGTIIRSQGAVTDDAMKTIREHPEWSQMLLPIVRRHIRFKDTIVKQKPLRYLDPRSKALPDIALVADALGYRRLNSTRKK